jgi:xanthine/uracil permease
VRVCVYVCVYLCVCVCVCVRVCVFCLCVRALPVQVMAQVIMVVGMQLYGIIVNRFAMLYAPPQV